MSIRVHLGELLEEQGLSQIQFSADSGIDQGSISRIKTGKKVPSLVTALRISQLLGVSVEDVFEMEA